MTRKLFLSSMIALFLLLAAGSTPAQQRLAPRVTQPVDDLQTVHLKGNTHPFARAEFDRGPIAESEPVSRMLLLLQRSDAQEAQLRQLLQDQLNAKSPSFHAWLTPEQFGQQFGPSDADIQTVTDWLTRQGFQVSKVSAGRTVIEFGGTAAQVQNAFHTALHHFSVSGKNYVANVSDPQIPTALAPVVAGVVSLHNFEKHSHSHVVGQFQKDLSTGMVKPMFTYTDKHGTFFGVGPADLAKIYNFPAAYNGTNVSIAIVGRSNLNIQDVRDFRTMFGLPPNDPQIILNGADPGIVSTGEESEADLDVEWSGAAAPGATIKFVVSESPSSRTQLTDGVDLSAVYIVDNNIAPIMSASFGQCESALGTGGNAFYNLLWQQAAAQGITVAVSTGDNGSAGCDPARATPNVATQGIAISGIASTPYNVAVGGTDFNQPTPTQFWNSINVAGTQLSALGYIPEVPWNNSTCAHNYPATCTAVASDGSDVVAASGGPSVVYTGSLKPSWQTGFGDTARDIPDISLFASNGFNFSFYVYCQSDVNPGGARCDLTTSPTSGTHNFSGVGGTSASTPVFAGIMAMVIQKTGQRQGNANPILYSLGKAQNNANCNSSSFTNPATPAPASCVFYDVTSGNNTVACVAKSPNCSNQGSSGFGVLVSSGTTPAFNAVAGYDMATGLGSVNVTNLLNAWAPVSLKSTQVQFTLNGGTGGITVAHDTSVNVSGQVTSAAGGIPSGIVLLRNSSGVAIDAFALDSAGKFSGSTALLPGGAYNVSAHYGGDTAFAISDSGGIPVNISQESSKTNVGFVSFSNTGVPNPPSSAAQTVVYGTPYILRIDVTGANGTSCESLGLGNGIPNYRTVPCPTGKITLTDNGAALNDFPNGATANATNVANLNNNGFTEDQPIQLNSGSHAIAASYSGDSSYAASSSNSLSVTVTKAATSTAVSSSLSTFPSGTSVTLTASIGTTSNGSGPTGSVTFTNNGATIGTGTCAPAGPTASAGASCKATLTTTISALYPPPAAKPGTPALPVAPVLFALLSLLFFLVGMRLIPQARRRAYAYGGLLLFAILAATIAGCGGGGGGGGGGSKTVTIGASYPGDTNYTASTGSIGVTVTK